MKSLSEFGWNLRRHAVGTRADASKENLSQASVRSIATRRSAPSTMIAQRITAVLDGAGSVRLDALVEAVARGLYREELGHGAAVLDIGVLGSRLFYPDVVAALYAGDGIY